MLNNKIQAYALGCLDPEETRQFRTDIKNDPDFNLKELGKYQNLAALFPSALSAEIPDEKVKEKIARKLYRLKQKTGIEVEPQEGEPPKTNPIRDIASEIINKSPAETGSDKFVRITGQTREPASFEETRKSKEFGDIKLTSTHALRPVKRSHLYIYSAAALILGFAIAFVFFSNKTASYQDEVERLNGEMQKLNSDMAVNSGLLSLLQKKDTKVYLLAGSETYPDGFGRIYLNYSTSRAYLYLSGLPVPSVGKKYQLWFMNSGGTFPIGLFTPKTDEGYFYFTMPKLGRETGRRFLLTEEPEEGSVTPGRKIYLRSPD